MSLEHFQKALLELYTKPDLMQMFFDNPDAFFARYELTAREKESLVQLPRKNLKQFQRDLAGKRSRVATKVLSRRPDSVVVAPFSRTGSAVVSWGTPIRTVHISPGMFLLLKHIANTNTVFTMGALLSAFSAVRPRSSAGDVFRIARLVYSERLTGKKISAPS